MRTPGLWAAMRACLNSIGANRVIDYREAQFAEVLRERVDVIFDLIGGDVQKRMCSAESRDCWKSRRCERMWPVPGGHCREAARQAASGKTRVARQDRASCVPAICCRLRLVAIAFHEEGLHFLVLQDFHGRLSRSVALRDCEERLLGLRHHRAREVVLVD